MRAKTPSPNARRGFTLMEAVLSIAIVGLAAGAVVSLTGVTATQRVAAQDQALATALAYELVNEALSKQAFEDGMSFGPTGVTEGSGFRVLFDDFDDYHEWYASPPEDIDGIPLDGYEGWWREAKVEFVRVADPGTLAGSATDAMRITVRVGRGEKPLATMTALRTRAGEEMTP